MEVVILKTSEYSKTNRQDVEEICLGRKTYREDRIKRLKY